MSKKPWLVLCGVVFLVSAAVACGESEGDGDGKGANGGGDGGSGGDGFEGLCDAEHPCPKGQSCLNGVCASGCQGDEQCGDGQHCDLEGGKSGRCKNIEVSTCSKGDQCLASQECRGGFCLEKAVEPPADCQWKASKKDAMDGCAADEICLPVDLDRMDGPSKCYKAPPCSGENTCPVGTHGATCNIGPDGEKMIPSKDAVCMLSLCREPADCATSGFFPFVCRDIGLFGFCEPQVSSGDACTADWECGGLTPSCCDTGRGDKQCMNGCL